jgi:peptidylprolyl isomerase
MTRPSPRSLLLPALLALVLGLAACGSDEETAATPTPTPTATATPDLTDLSVKPVIAKPTGDPPAELVKRDIVVGKGRPAKAGDEVTVQYVGASFSTGEEFDASWNSGQPFPFTLGAGQVIAGWDQGVPGMRKGGRRELVIPAAKAYGDTGSPPTIAPGETLIFVVDVVGIAPGSGS